MSYAPAADRYQTFWHRFAASLIDGAVLSPVTLPINLIGYAPRSLAIAAILFAAPAGWLYTSYCHGRWGKTVGKMAVGIAVRRASDDGPISYGRALLRDCGTVAFSTLSAALLISLVVRGDTERFRMFDNLDTQVQFEQREPGAEPPVIDPWAPLREAFDPWLFGLAALQMGWSAAELITMLSNPRRRAVHDLIGGTVVVKVPWQPPRRAFEQPSERPPAALPGPRF